MPLGINVGECRNKEGGLLLGGEQLPATRLTELKKRRELILAEPVVPDLILAVV